MPRNIYRRIFGICTKIHGLVVQLEEGQIDESLPAFYRSRTDVELIKFLGFWLPGLCFSKMPSRQTEQHSILMETLCQKATQRHPEKYLPADEHYYFDSFWMVLPFSSRPELHKKKRKAWLQLALFDNAPLPSTVSEPIVTIL
jgi:hypothetical protein